MAMWGDERAGGSRAGRRAGAAEPIFLWSAGASGCLWPEAVACEIRLCAQPQPAHSSRDGNASAATTTARRRGGACAAREPRDPATRTGAQVVV